MSIKQATSETLAEAVTVLGDGELVAFPTETVYGLGADATNSAAVAKIYALKQRPSFNPLICHVATMEQAERIALFNDRARMLAQMFWPGPLTMVLPLHPDSGLSDLVTAGLPTVAVRIPSHPVALDLLRRVDRPVAAPSANLSGTVSPTSALHVAQSFGDTAPLILAGGSSMIGLESTIIDVSGDKTILLRPGHITYDDLLVCDTDITLPDTATPAHITAPGQMTRHYATRTPLRLNAVDVKSGEALLAFGSLKFMGAQDHGFAKNMPAHLIRNLSAEGDLSEAAANLFRMMRDLDQSDASSIAVMAIPDHAVGVAINDRLRRAATQEDTP
jgi:L-threonylcarbamoyladenylate synthase